MKLSEFAKLTGSVLVVFFFAAQLGCDFDRGSSYQQDDETQDSANDSFGSFQPPKPKMADPSGYEFETPVRLMAGGEFISVESPGYACPTMADVDEDGKLDLVVGQFSNGKMHYFKNIAKEGALPEFAKREWIKTGSEPAVVPGVW